MTSIDEVTASFAASLALAGSDVVDISHLNGSDRRSNSQAFLLAKPMTKKQFGTQDLQRHFRRIWIIDGAFKVHDSTQGRFVFSFDLKRDRNKVLRGGPWYFNKAPVLLQHYDGMEDPLVIPMNLLFFWVKITGIPPALEEKTIIMNVASVAGKYLDFDQRLYNNKNQIRVHVAHAISHPFFLKRTLKIIPGVVKEITFFYENLHGICKDCQLLCHEQDVCPTVDAQAMHNTTTRSETSGKSLTSHFPGLSDLRFQNGSFRFQGLQTPLLPPVVRNLFGTSAINKHRKPIVVRSENLRPAAEGNALALVPVDVEPSTVKRNRPASPYTSPKKLKFLFHDGETAASSAMLPKKLKVPEFHTKFSAKSLGLIAAPGGVLVPKEGSLPKESLQLVKVESKKKRGRPLGSKNKNSSKVEVGTMKQLRERIARSITSGLEASESLVLELANLQYYENIE
ncbi:uncharacterized protein LOC133730088 [Rosa rugosa]|uniref:uncharacterized protein LOC133730088 n=1 Tax=Rosa rugosa TaxID=74645 RepID=UPI002B4125E5|nr:uncharacterized protein LOC133730088 [Rosa rugosa]